MKGWWLIAFILGAAAVLYVTGALDFLMGTTKDPAYYARRARRFKRKYARERKMKALIKNIEDAAEVKSKVSADPGGDGSLRISA